MTLWGYFTYCLYWQSPWVLLWLIRVLHTHKNTQMQPFQMIIRFCLCSLPTFIQKSPLFAPFHCSTPLFILTIILPVAPCLLSFILFSLQPTVSHWSHCQGCLSSSLCCSVSLPTANSVVLLSPVCYDTGTFQDTRDFIPPRAMCSDDWAK